MSLLDIVRQARRHLEENGRVSYAMLQREFGLDDDALAAVIDELVDVQGVATREAKVLSWTGGAAAAKVVDKEALSSLFRLARADHGWFQQERFSR